MYHGRIRPARLGAVAPTPAHLLLPGSDMAKGNLPLTILTERAHYEGSGGGDKHISAYVLEHAMRLAPWQQWSP